MGTKPIKLFTGTYLDYINLQHGDGAEKAGFFTKAIAVTAPDKVRRPFIAFLARCFAENNDYRVRDYPTTFYCFGSVPGISEEGLPNAACQEMSTFVTPSTSSRLSAPHPDHGPVDEWGADEMVIYPDLSALCITGGTDGNINTYHMRKAKVLAQLFRESTTAQTFTVFGNTNSRQIERYFWGLSLRINEVEYTPEGTKYDRGVLIVDRNKHGGIGNAFNLLFPRDEALTPLLIDYAYVATSIGGNDTPFVYRARDGEAYTEDTVHEGLRKELHVAAVAKLLNLNVDVLWEQVKNIDLGVFPLRVGQCKGDGYLCLEEYT